MAGLGFEQVKSEIFISRTAKEKWQKRKKKQDRGKVEVNHMLWTQKFVKETEGIGN